MSLTDPVADFLARVRNAILAKQQKVDVPASKLKLEIARILKEEGYIANFKATEEEGQRLLRGARDASRGRAEEREERPVARAVDVSRPEDDDREALGRPLAEEKIVALSLVPRIGQEID